MRLRLTKSKQLIFLGLHGAYFEGVCKLFRGVDLVNMVLDPTHGVYFLHVGLLRVPCDEDGFAGVDGVKVS